MTNEARSHLHAYELFVERAIEDYKDTIPRSAFLRIGDEAVARLAATSATPLTEVLIWQEVDRIVSERLRLPTYEHWRSEHGLSDVRTTTIFDPAGKPIERQSPSHELVVVINETIKDLVVSLNRDPTRVFGLSARQFEHLVAELLSRDGFEVEVTPATRDGGKDIIASLKTTAGSFVVYVECKRYSPHRRVGVSVARELIGIVHLEQASAGLLVTTSSFSEPAVKLSDSMPRRLQLKAYTDLVEWIGRLR